MLRWGLGLLCLLLPGCGPGSDGPRPLKIWHAFEGSEQQKLNELCAAYGVKTEVLAVPFEGLKNKVLVAAPAGQGPDLIIGPQDWLGVFSAAKLLEPLPAAMAAQLAKDVSPVAAEGVTYDGKAYAYPLLLEGLALLRNPKLAPRSPKNLQELKQYALELEAGGVKGFYFDLRELYFSWPFFSAYGAKVFRENLQPGMTGPEGVEAAQYLRGLREAGLIPVGAKNDFAKSLFLEGKLAMTLNGPWFLSDIRAKGLPYVIEPIPPGPHPANSFVGITGLMVNAQSQRKDEAFKFIEYMGSRDNIVALALASGRVPARLDAQVVAAKDPERGEDLKAFTRVVQQGVAMPNHPAANAVWDPMKQSLELISKGEVDAATELQATERQIREKIERMVE
jgi:maltose-binding protein MalE